jgi:hypothetical protein
MQFSMRRGDLLKIMGSKRFSKGLFTRWHAEIVSGAWEACPYGYSGYGS